ncbi:Ig-like domain-containing protein [Bacillus dakarensis]|uniref:Ig-like domain-containing protein n=1 Tax=Robertmurraya dakarensis TaxID=1926278 RepID=UPI0009812D59|nr:Ig-like domain-containing protein [Bacillus dakarensis]
MKKTRMILSSFVLACLAVLLTSVGSHAAAENYKNFEMVNHVPLHHDWTIKFNRILDAKTVSNAHVFIEDSSGQKLTNDVEVADDNTTITVHAPQHGYQSDQTFTLYVTSGIKAKGGASLKEEVKMPFTTVSVKNGLLPKITDCLYLGMTVEEFEAVIGRPDEIYVNEDETTLTYDFNKNGKVYNMIFATFSHNAYALTYFEKYWDEKDPLIANKTVKETYQVLKNLLTERFGRSPDHESLTPEDIEDIIPNDSAVWYEGTEIFELNVSEPLFERGEVIVRIEVRDLKSQ